MKDPKIKLQLILEGCRNNNPLSQRKLYEYYFGIGMNIAMRYGKNREEALEILNDGFLKIFRYIDRYDSAYPFKVWLRKVIANAGIDYYRAQKNKLSFSELTEIHSEMEDNVPMPTISNKEDMLPVIQQLSPAYRLVFNLYVMEEYKHHEIAEKLGISVGTSKSNLARAKAKIKKAMLQNRDQKIQTR